MTKSRWQRLDEGLSPIEKLATILGFVVAGLVAFGVLTSGAPDPSGRDLSAVPSLTTGSPAAGPSAGASHPTDSSGEAPSTLSPTPTSGPWSYTADWTAGLQDWSVSNGWRASGGTLLNDGADLEGRALPDYLPPSSDYTVTAEIELVRGGSCFWFALEARLVDDHGYRAGIGNRPTNGGFCGEVTVRLWDGRDGFDSKPIQLPLGVHLYELTVQGTSIRFSIDGSRKVQLQSTVYGEPGNAAIWAADAELIVRSFSVTEIPVSLAN